MLSVIKSSIFDSPAQTLVNTVNTVGVMGKGIAKEFKARYPAMFREYKHLCDRHVLKIGTLHCWPGPSRWILNFPTKTTWKKPSRMEYLDAGLETFVRNYKRMGIQSVSFPPLGCGNGQLHWEEVKPLMLYHLWNLDIQIYIHEWFEGSNLPEQADPAARVPPVAYSEFLSDLHALVDERNGRFATLATHVPYHVRFLDGENLEATRDRPLVIPEEVISTAWAGLQLGLLTPYTLGSEVERYARFLFPVLASLPYVQTTRVQLDPQNPKRTSAGLFLREAADGYDGRRLQATQEAQGCLSL